MLIYFAFKIPAKFCLKYFGLNFSRINLIWNWTSLPWKWFSNKCPTIVYALFLFYSQKRLFSSLDEQYYFNRPTYAALIQLLDNYDSVLGRSEHRTDHENTEEAKFMNEISKTSLMQHTLDFLHQHGNKSFFTFTHTYLFYWIKIAKLHCWILKPHISIFDNLGHLVWLSSSFHLILYIYIYIYIHVWF